MKWILDTDCGIDDAQAVLLALKFLDVVAITGVNGNTGVENSVKNVAIITGLCGKKVPIYKGMQRPILKDVEDASAYHAIDGLGGVQQDWIDKADLDNIKEENAVNAIIRHVNEEHKAGNKIGIGTIGPMTNLAMAIRLEDSIIAKIDQVYCMGGTVNGWGNWTLCTEYNFRADPIAAKIGIASFPMTHLLPWETAAEFSITGEAQEILCSGKTELSKFFKEINIHNESYGDGKIYCCDGLGVSAIINPDIVVETRQAYGEVGVEGPKTEGAIFFNMFPTFVFDHTDVKNVTQLNKIDHDMYVELLSKSLGLIE